MQFCSDASPQKCNCHGPMILDVGQKEKDMNNTYRELPKGWFWASDIESIELFSELQKELHPLHVLKNEPIKVVAHRNGGNDDILCGMIERPGNYKIVYLTWIGKIEIDSNHPSIEFSGTLSDLFEYEKLYSIE
jgi:hypothetical protein